jgi:uncharacterized paraquat-inducible protein A
MRLITFFKSLFWHVYKGFPKSTKQQILDRYSICLSCEFLDKEKAQCLQCGCNINNKRIFLNKLAWADQECPIGNWSKIN